MPTPRIHRLTPTIFVLSTCTCARDAKKNRFFISLFIFRHARVAAAGSPEQCASRFRFFFTPSPPPTSPNVHFSSSSREDDEIEDSWDQKCEDDPPVVPFVDDVGKCSNGIAGIDANGVVCCPLACNKCAGAGCTTFGAEAGLVS